MLLLIGCSRQETRVGVLVSGPGRMERVTGLVQALKENYPELRIDICNGQGSPAHLQRCARELESQGARVLVTVGGIETQSALAGTHRVPILYVGLAASLDWGFVKDLRAPGGRVSGVDNGYAELTGKRLEWWVRAFPETRRVLVLYQPEVIPTPRALAHLERASETLGVALIRFPVQSAEDLVRLKSALNSPRPNAALILPSHILENHLDSLIARLNEAGIPLIGLNREQTRRGAALAFGASNRALGRQGARMVAKLLAGYPVAALPVERPDLPELTLNPRALGPLGLSPAPWVLDLAQTP